jgi:hypothetical protein
MVSSEELIGTTEHVTLYSKCRLNRCRCNRVRLILKQKVTECVHLGQGEDQWWWSPTLAGLYSLHAVVLNRTLA